MFRVRFGLDGFQVNHAQFTMVDSGFYFFKSMGLSLGKQRKLDLGMKGYEFY